MKDAASGAVASFNTSFTFSITGLNYWYNENGFLHGDGLAFTFGTNNNSVQGEVEAGGSLCLWRAASNTQFFAVEFDTY